MTCGIAGTVTGRLGIHVSGVAKSTAVVRSPTVVRRQALRFGTSAPKRVSRKRSTEVWSKRSDDTNPPRANGETIGMGTRNPKPIGPVMGGLPNTAGSGTAGAVTYSPACRLARLAVEHGQKIHRFRQTSQRGMCGPTARVSLSERPRLKTICFHRKRTARGDDPT